MNPLRILILRIRLCLLRYERALRIDSVLQNYAQSTEALTTRLMAWHIEDVEEEIAVTLADIAALRAPEPLPGTAESALRRERLAAVGVWIGLAAIMLALIALAGCSDAGEPRPERSGVTSSGYRVEQLFTLDGCTVYRFFDGGYRYFTNCSGSTGWNESSGKT